MHASILSQGQWDDDPIPPALVAGLVGAVAIPPIVISPEARHHVIDHLLQAKTVLGSQDANVLHTQLHNARMQLSLAVDHVAKFVGPVPKAELLKVKSMLAELQDNIRVYAKEVPTSTLRLGHGHVGKLHNPMKCEYKGIQGRRGQKKDQKGAKSPTFNLIFQQGLAASLISTWLGPLLWLGAPGGGGGTPPPPPAMLVRAIGPCYFSLKQEPL